MNDDKKDRIIQLMRLAAEYIEEHWPEGIIHYDDADCDGFCLAEDLKTAAEDLEDIG